MTRKSGAAIDVVELALGPLTFTARCAGPADGRLVLLLHGFPQSSWQWRHQLAALAAAGYRAVAPDQRGYSPGARPVGVQHYGIDHLVADVVALADELGAHRVDVVGHDWGGVVAWALAARHPGRLRSLAVVSTPHPAAFAGALADAGADQARRSAYIAALRAEGAAEEALLGGDGAGLRALFAASGYPEGGDEAEYVRLLREPGALTAALSWYRAASLEAAAATGRVATPTLYVWSDGDVALGREAAEATAAHVEGPYRFEVLSGVGHWVPEEAPDALARLLLEHLAASP